MTKDNQVPHINVDYFEDLTGKVSPEDQESVEAVGEKISKLREERGISCSAPAPTG